MVETLLTFQLCNPVKINYSIDSVVWYSENIYCIGSKLFIKPHGNFITSTHFPTYQYLSGQLQSTNPLFLYSPRPHTAKNEDPGVA